MIASDWRLWVFLIASCVASSCDSCLPASCGVPEKRKFEIQAIALHQACVQNNPCYFVEQCHRQSELYCEDAGYSKTCGNGEIEGSCGVNVK